MTNVNTVGAFEVKTHFSKILSLVCEGQEFVITLRDKPVAKLTPLNEDTDLAQVVHELLSNIKKTSKKIDLKALIDEGRE